VRVVATHPTAAAGSARLVELPAHRDSVAALLVAALGI
jgi:hypothetical protein